ncbi:MAG TPA: hypothetical protein VK922_16540 [Gemmatimonadaceae bacterium]|nr:hypothetical protein [Gemmatimonadaceae bacterium]
MRELAAAAATVPGDEGGRWSAGAREAVAQRARYLRRSVTKSRPSWATYASVLEFAAVLRADLADLQPRDMIDIQSFIWVLGSAEYD